MPTIDSPLRLAVLSTMEAALGCFNRLVWASALSPAGLETEVLAEVLVDALISSPAFRLALLDAVASASANEDDMAMYLLDEMTSRGVVR